MNSRSNFLTPCLIFVGYLFYFVLLFHPVVWGGQTFIKPDIHNFYYPVWHYGVSCMKQGVIPLWNPYNAFGAPFLANIQTCVFYPPTLLFYLPDFTWGFNFYILLHLAMASFFTYLWMREMGVSRIAAILSGFAFGMSGYAMSVINLTTTLCSLTYFPLALLVFRRALERPGFLWKGTSSAVLLLQYLAGEPGNACATAIVLMLMTAHRTWVLRKNGFRACLGPWGVFAAVYAAFLALSAFQSLAFLEFLAHSDRVGGDAGGRLLYSMPPGDLWGVVIPFLEDIYFYVRQPWEFQCWVENLYAGVSIVALAGIACSNFAERKIRAHLLLAGVGIVLSLGAYSRISSALYRGIPLLGLVRYPARFLFIVSFSLACLAGFGWQKLREGAERGLPASGRNEVLQPFLWMFVICSALLLIFFHPLAEFIRHSIEVTWQGAAMPPHFDQQSFDSSIRGLLINARRSVIFLMLSCGLIAGTRVFKDRGKVILWAILMIVFLDLSLANATQPVTPSPLLERPSANISVMARDAGLYRAMSSPLSAVASFSVDTVDWGTKEPVEKNGLISNELLLYGISDVFGFDSVFVKETRILREPLFKLSDPSQGRFMDMLNIKYIASPHRNLGFSFTLLHRTPAANLFRNERVLPRAFLVKRAVVLPVRRDILPQLLRQDRDPLNEIFIEEEPVMPAETTDIAGAFDEIRSIEYLPHRIKIEVTAKERPWLFISDAFYPGWKCTVDGLPTKIYRANYAFRAVLLATGKHRVEFIYDPLLFKIGTAISLVMSAVLLRMFFAGPRAGRKRVV